MSMLKAELGKVKKNRLLMVTLIVVMLIPSIYSTIFLKSMWDTYERMDHFPVAVINNDKPAEKMGKAVNIGDELTKTLDESNDMDFKPMSAEEAKEGLDAGKYYMAITIPETFSENSLTLMDETPKQMNLTYETSAGHNFTASKFSDVAAGRIKNEVQNKVTRTYAQTVLGQFKKAGLGLEQAGDGAMTLANGLGQLEAGSNKLGDGANQLNNGLGQLATGLGTYTNGVGQAASGSQQLAAGGDKLQAGVNAYTNGVTLAASKAPTLQAGISQYTAGVGQAADKAPALSEGIDQYTTGVKLAAEKAPELGAGIKAYTAGVKVAKEGSDNIAQGTKQLSDGLSAMDASVNSQAVTDLTTGMSAYKTQVNKLKDMSAGETPEQKAIMANMQSLATQVATLGELAKSPDLSDKDRAVLVTSLTQSQKDLSSLKTNLEAQKAQASQLALLADGYNQLDQGMTKYIGQTQTAASQLAPGAKKLSAGATRLDSGLKQLTDKNDMLNSGADQLVSGLEQLSGKNSDVTGGVNQLVGGLNQLSSKNGQLNDGTNQLVSGLGQLSSRGGELQSGANQAVGGINQLNNGLTQLTANSGRLQSAVGQLGDGSGQLANGAGQLNVGLVKANDGAEELGTKLSDGADQVKQVRDDKETLDMFAAPIKETHEDRTTVKNNGTGMAPYMIAIYVFVGMITLMAAMHLTEPASYPTSSLTWWLSKYTIPFVLVFVGAIITTLVSITLIGLEPVNLGGFLISLIVIAIMDMSIVYFFTAAFGKIGTFISLILLVLQLSASGGTYPIQLSSGFFQWLHPYLPMTYAIQALRGSLSTGLSITQPILIMLGIFVVFSLLSWAYFAIQMSKRYRFGDKGNAEIAEEK